MIPLWPEPRTSFFKKKKNLAENKTTGLSPMVLKELRVSKIPGVNFLLLVNEYPHDSYSKFRKKFFFSRF